MRGKTNEVEKKIKYLGYVITGEKGNRSLEDKRSLIKELKSRKKELRIFVIYAICFSRKYDIHPVQQ